MMSLLRSPLWFVLAVAGLLVFGYPHARNLLLQVEVTPAERGYYVALEAGCFSCHGPNGIGGVNNPGNEDGDVPGFAEGMPMMWASSEQEIRDYILDGAPQRKLDDPKYRDEIAGWLLVMPAYRDYLSGRDVDDLVAYIGAVSGLIMPPDDATALGQELAYELGCFDCHGPMGAGGVKNPGSLKGYIPGWWGHDYRDLVRDDAELRAWIVAGRIQRLDDHPIAPYFTEGQRIKMPAYRDLVDEEQLAALMAYVKWVNEGSWQDTGMALGH